MRRLTLSFLMLVLPGLAWGFPLGEQFLAACDQDASPEARDVCDAYLTGIVQTTDALAAVGYRFSAAAPVAAEVGRTLGIADGATVIGACLPAEVPARELRRLMLRVLKAKPELQAQPTVMGVLTLLRAGWPCEAGR